MNTADKAAHTPVLALPLRHEPSTDNLCGDSPDELYEANSAGSLVDADNVIVARIWADCESPQEKAAQIVAAVNAAPELLEALKEYDKAFTEFDPESGPSRNRMRLAVVKARAALAKAQS